MSENILSVSRDGAQIQDLKESVTGGELLRRAREAAGLHIGALAVSLKVPVKKLEALEADRFDLLPGTVFVRALAASVCRNLKIDPDPILERMPHSTAVRLKVDESGINVPFRATKGGANLLFWKQMSKPFMGVVLGLLGGVVVLLLFPLWPTTEVATATRSESVLAVPAPPAAFPARAESDEMATPAPTSVSAPGGANLPGLLTNNVEPVTAAQSMSGSAPIPGAGVVPGSGATSGMVVFKANGRSWIEVVDANGVVQVRQNIAKGDVVGASGVLPLSVVVGRADATEVLVHGKSFDLTRIAKDQVARFEVK